MIKSRKIYSNPFHKTDEITEVKFSSGFRLLMKQTNKAQQKAIIFFKFGSYYNHFKDYETGEEIILPDGIAHFLEHKMFDKKEGEKILDLYENVNAATGYDITNYYVGTNNNIYDAIDAVLKLVYKPVFSKESIAKEQGIIGQEIDGSKSNPLYKASRNLLDLMYNGSVISKRVLGEKDTISKITPEMLYSICSNFYVTGNATMFVTGKFDEREVISFTEILLDEYAKQQKSVPDILFDEIKPCKRFVIEKASVNQDYLNLGFRLPGNALGQEKLKCEIMTAIYHKMYFSDISKFACDMLEKDVISKSMAAYNYCNRYVNLSSVSATGKDYKKMKQLILSYINKEVLVAPIDKDIFEIIKKTIYAEYFRAFAAYYSLEDNVSQTISLDVENPFEILNMIPKINEQDFYDYRKKIFDMDNLFISVLIPEDK